MSDEPNEFRDWLDARSINAKQASELFGVEEQTIRHWRSKGVPERRRLHVEAVMAAYGKAAESGPRMLAEITVRPSIPQLQAWHNAAQAQGKDLETWTIDGLDQLAAEAETPPKVTVSSSPILAAFSAASQAQETIVAFPEIPLLHAAAGAPIAADGETFSPTRDYGPGRFAVKLHGDSMAPKYPDGSVVILREKGKLSRPVLKNNETYLFVVEGERTLKIYASRKATKPEIQAGISYQSTLDGTPKTRVLKSINPAYPEIVVPDGTECDWLGWLDPDDN